jgi:regulatory protein
MANHEWSLDELRHKAEAYCATAEHCCSEVHNKLQLWGANEEYVTIILQRLQADGYINEARYCHAFAHDKVAYQGWGRVKIKAALYAKKIPNLLIENALNEINEEEYHTVLYRVLSTKHRALKRDAMAREKLIRFCLQRGFTYDEIESTLRKFTN